MWGKISATATAKSWSIVFHRLMVFWCTTCSEHFDSSNWAALIMCFFSTSLIEL
jgi:hypothetical protein